MPGNFFDRAEILAQSARLVPQVLILDAEPVSLAGKPAVLAACLEGIHEPSLPHDGVGHQDAAHKHQEELE